MRFLRQSTASQEILLGPFVATADGSAQTGLTIANTDIKLLVGGATSEANKNSGGGTHIAGGRYSAVLDATDTATVGILEVSVNPTSGIPWNKSYYVLEEAVYDEIFGASALGYIANAPVNVAQISGDSTAADNLETAYDDTAGAVPWVGIIDQGTAQAATGTTIQLRSAATFADDTPIGATVWAYGSTQGYWQVQVITDYVSATDTATVPGWTVTPSGTITYKVFGSAAGTGVAQTGDAYAIVSSGTYGNSALKTLIDTADTVVDAIKVKTDYLPSATAGAAGGVFIAGTNAATTVTTALTTTFTGNLTGSVGSVTGAVGSVTGNVGGNVTGSIGSLATQAKADVNGEVVDGLTVDVLADSVATDGSRPTIGQALLMINRFLMERSVSSTTMTVKKEDGSTSSMTFTLNSATAPTSITRAS